jgi:glycerate 2-kinase
MGEAAGVAVVVLAPNAFKGTIGPVAAAEALAAGWSAARPRDVLRLVPMADGGDGTLEALASARSSVLERAHAPGQLIAPPVEARWQQGADGTAVLELASIGGLAVLAGSPVPPRRRAATADTTGFGEAVRIAIERGADELVLAIGGSASTDGGAGFLSALGARFLDRDGRPVPTGNAGLAGLRRIDVSALTPPPARGAVVLTDVTNPLLGPSGAAAVFGAQKGASAEDLPAMEANLARFAAIVAGVLPADPASPGAGAAGGLGFGLTAWGARIVDGAAEVARRVGLARALRGADVVVTGEGRFDDQTAGGKAPERVHALAAAARVPALLVAGSIAAPTAGWGSAVALTDLAGSSSEALADPARWLAEAGRVLAGQAAESLFRD